MFMRNLPPSALFSTGAPQSAPLAGELNALEGIDLEQRSKASLKYSHRAASLRLLVVEDRALRNGLFAR
jgi:hypothetical protein